MSLIDTIKSADDRRLSPIPIPEWGAPEGLYLRALQANTRWAIEQGYISGEMRAPKDFMPLVIRACLCDAEGNEVFGDDAGEVLGRKDSAVVARVFTAAMKHAGLTEEAVQETAASFT